MARAARARKAPRLLTPQLANVFLAMFGAMSSFYLLLSVVPYYATAVGGTGVDAGLSTGTLLLFTSGGSAGHRGPARRWRS